MRMGFGAKGAGARMLSFLRGENNLNVGKKNDRCKRTGRIRLSDGSWVYAFED